MSLLLFSMAGFPLVSHAAEINESTQEDMQEEEAPSLKERIEGIVDYAKKDFLWKRRTTALQKTESG